MIRAPGIQTPAFSMIDLGTKKLQWPHIGDLMSPGWTGVPSHPASWRLTNTGLCDWSSPLPWCYQLRLLCICDPFCYLFLSITCMRILILFTLTTLSGPPATFPDSLAIPNQSPLSSFFLLSFIYLVTQLVSLGLLTEVKVRG